MADVRSRVNRDSLARKVSGKTGASTLVGLQLANDATANIVLDIGESVCFTVTLSARYGTPRILATPHISLYQTTVGADNSIPDGDNIQAGDWEVVIWSDWGTTDNKNCKMKVYVRNTSVGDAFNVIIKANWRFLFEEAE